MDLLTTRWKKLLEVGLDEDGAALDWSARAVARDRDLHAYIVAKADGVLCAEAGVRALKLIAHNFAPDRALSAQLLHVDGAKIEKGQKLIEIRGPALTVLALERPFLNVMGYLCGIATATHRLVTRVRDLSLTHAPRITPTRKILPGFRDLAIHAAILGGAHPHRVNLAGGVLLKENHIAAVGGILQAVTLARGTAPHGLKIEIEVRNLVEYAQALDAGAEVIMLDNFKIEDIKKAVSLKRPGVLLEVSGGVTEESISALAETGVDIISVGGITHSPKNFDLSLLEATLTR